MPALFSTARRPCPLSRALARVLAGRIPSSRYAARGIASIDSLADKARRAGYRRVVVLREESGKPSGFTVYAVDATGWAVLRSIELKSVKTAKAPKPPEEVVDSLAVKDTGGLALAELFDVEDDPSASVSLVADAAKITFFRSEDEIGPKLELRR